MMSGDTRTSRKSSKYSKSWTHTTSRSRTPSRPDRDGRSPDDDQSVARDRHRSESHRRSKDRSTQGSREKDNRSTDAQYKDLKRSSSGTWKVKEAGNDQKSAGDTKSGSKSISDDDDDDGPHSKSHGRKGEKRIGEHELGSTMDEKKAKYDSYQYRKCTRQTELCDRVFREGSQAVVILQPLESLIFRGKAKVQCLRGALSVLGYTITASDQIHLVYSPDTNSLLKLNAVNSSPGPWPDLQKVISETFSKSVVNAIEDCTNNSVVILMSTLDSRGLQFVSTVQGYRNIFGNPDCKPRSGIVILENIGELYKYGAGGIDIPQDHHKAAEWVCDQITGGKNPVIVVCGGQDVGKSTLARYLINKCLNLVPDVQFLDCDLGQTEFTIPGCLSLTRITSPILGPPFTHQREPVCSCFVGSLSPADNPEYYMKCLQHVYQKYSSEMPLIVNTMGWNKGMGLSLLADTLRMIRPDLVIQLVSDSKHKNMPPVDRDFVQSSQGWVANKPLSEQDTCSDSHKLMSIKSAVNHDPEFRRPNQFRALDHRNLALLACLGECVQSGTLQSVTPYEVPWSAVAVHAAQSAVPRTQIMYSLNASIVGLCLVHIDQIESSTDGLPGLIKGNPAFEYIGCGLVRGIDPDKKVFYIVTSLTADECGKVNCLVRGSIELPQQLLLNQKAEDVPYVGNPKDGIGASSVSRRRHMARRRGTPTVHT